ncbi:MAG: hypothetical protein ACFFA0_00780 [Promethearchaeota archaeon]
MIKINFDCPCPKKTCINHGNCEKCKKYHFSGNSVPFCQRNHGLFTKIFYRKNYEMVQLLRGEGKI